MRRVSVESKSSPTMKPLSSGGSKGSSEMFQSKHIFPGVNVLYGIFSVQAAIIFAVPHL